MSEVPFIADSGCKGETFAAGSGAAQAPGRMTVNSRKEKNALADVSV